MAAAIKRSLLTPALSGWILGTIFQLQQADLWPWIGYLVLLLITPVLYGVALFFPNSLGLKQHQKWRQHGWRLLITASIACFAFGVCGLRAHSYIAQNLAPDYEGQDIHITGIVTSMPQPSDSGLRFRFAPESAAIKGQIIQLPPLIDLSWYANSPDFNFSNSSPPPYTQADSNHPLSQLRAGQRWQMTVRLKAPHGLRNPHGFDYELWLWEQGVQATGYIRAGKRDPPPTLLASTYKHPIELMRHAVRDAIYLRLKEPAASLDTPLIVSTEEQKVRALKSRVAGIIAALVVGDQRAIHQMDWDSFRTTGVAHLMSISGLHITIFAWLAALLIGYIWRRHRVLCQFLSTPNAALIGGVILASAYAAFSGWGIPAQRTILMLISVSLLRLCGLRWPWPYVWLLAGVLVLMLDPWALLQAGFWLSFTAIGILLLVNQKHEQATVAQNLTTRLVRQKIGAQAQQMLQAQWVITLGLTPVTLLLFGQVSLVSLFANAIAIPWLTLVIMPLPMLGVIAPFLWDISAITVEWLVIYLAWLNSWPIVTFNAAIPPLWTSILGVVGGLLIVMRLPLPLRGLGIPLILAVLLWKPTRPITGEFEVMAADIGQGNAVIVRTQSHTLLYDAGPRYGGSNDAGSSVLIPLLDALNSAPDLLMLSHNDADHAGGAPSILQNYPATELIGSLHEADFLPLQRPLAQRCSAGQKWLWDGVLFEILHPKISAYETAAKSNALSCVLRISSASQSALLVGDIGIAQEAELVRQNVDLSATFLLMPHHGSQTSSSSIFLKAVQPRFAFAQTGYKNRYKHPAKQVTQRYLANDIRIFDSPKCGAGIWRSAMPETVICHRESEQRYWHHRTENTP